MTKKLLILAGCLFLSLNLGALEAGLFTGPSSSPDTFTYGLSAGMGSILPMITLEVEGWKLKEQGLTALSGALKFRPKLGKFSPYLIIGVGTEFEKLNFHFSQYHTNTIIGGGAHLFFSGVLSLRFDLRFLHFSDIDRTRISGGIFIHL
jgi:hypothetical protein